MFFESTDARGALWISNDDSVFEFWSWLRVIVDVSGVNVLSTKMPRYSKDQRPIRWCSR